MSNMRYLLRPRSVFITIIIIYFFGLLSHALYLQKVVYGDGMYYFSWLHTLFADHNIDFTTEYRYFGLTKPDGTGNFQQNMYSIGPAIFWGIIYNPVYTLLGGNGLSFPYQIFTGYITMIYSIISLILLYKILEKFFSIQISLLSILAMALCTNLLFYSAIDPINSHTLTFFTAVLFLSFILQTSTLSTFYAGLSLGLLGLVRMQDMIYGLYFLFIPKKKVSTIVFFMSGIFLALLPQSLLWQYLHGKFYESPYFAQRALYFIPFEPKILEVLFAVKNGLFLLTPITAISILGLAYATLTKKHVLNIIHLMIFLLQLYIVSIRNEWWQDASFSGRMFVSIIPQFSFGFASFVQVMLEKLIISTRFLIYFVCILFVLNITLIIWYLWVN